MRSKKGLVALGFVLCMVLSILPVVDSYADSTVYVTKYGKKYHTSRDCSGLNNASTTTPILLSAAQRAGYEPCERCVLSGSTTPSPAPAPAPTIPILDTINTDETQVNMFRMYNPNTGEHFYTSSLGEGNALLEVGWQYEGIAWKAPLVSDTPVYRLCNPNSGEHHYSISEYESSILKSIGWNYEGIGWYSSDNKVIALHRLYNPNATGNRAAGAHHYTIDIGEANALVSQGWNYEGIGWYGN